MFIFKSILQSVCAKSFLTAVILLGSFSYSAARAEVEGKCVKQSSENIRCTVYPRTNAAVSGVAALIGTDEANVTNRTQIDAPETEVAWYFLVDATRTNRQAAIEASVSTIDTLTSLAQPKHVFGLGEFTDDLASLVSGPATAEDIQKELGQITPKNVSPQLFTSIKSALDVLSTYPQKRRVLVVFSDGEPEFQTFTIENVIKDAVDSGVMLATIGLPSDSDGEKYFGNLEKLADETGGAFLKAKNGSAAIDPTELGAFYMSFMNQVEIDMDPLVEAPNDIAELYLMLSGGGMLQLETPIVTPEPILMALISKNRKFVMIGLGGLVVLILLLLIMKKGKGAKKGDSSERTSAHFENQPSPQAPPKKVQNPQPKPQAKVVPKVSAEEQSELPPYAVIGLKPKDPEAAYKTIYRKQTTIGRSPECDLTLPHDTVSRTHAKIEYHSNKVCTIEDLGSTNGILVNSRKVDRAEISNGDTLQIGELAFTFEHVYTNKN